MITHTEWAAVMANGVEFLGSVDCTLHHSAWEVVAKHDTFAAEQRCGVF
jgi:hypothetical protein